MNMCMFIYIPFSKWAGLAGLRAGYALGDPAIIEYHSSTQDPTLSNWPAPEPEHELEPAPEPAPQLEPEPGLEG